MIEQKTAFKIGAIIVMLLLLAWFESIPAYVRGDWNFLAFVRTYIKGLIMGALFTLPFWIILKFVKRE